MASLATFACTLLIYYGLPLRPIQVISDVVGVGMFIIGIGGLAWLVIYAIRKYAAAPTDTGNRMLGALLIVYLVVIGFAMIYYLIEESSSGQFSGLETRTDSLYFTIITLGTVGYGDIVPVGQLARTVAMVQVLFDLVLIGLLLSIAGSHVTQRLATRRSTGRGVN